MYWAEKKSKKFFLVTFLATREAVFANFKIIDWSVLSRCFHRHIKIWNPSIIGHLIPDSIGRVRRINVGCKICDGTRKKHGRNNSGIMLDEDLTKFNNRKNKLKNPPLSIGLWTPITYYKKGRLNKMWILDQESSGI